MSIDLSIIIATYNRAELLAETVESLLQTDMKGLSCEIIIVDNNSADDTPRVIKELVQRDKRIKIAMESKQGLSFARNKGLEVAKGKIIAFLDDDFEIDEHWPKEMLRPFEDLSVWVVTGKVNPYGDIEIPDWLPKKLMFLLSINDYGTKEKVLSGKEKPLGGNMAIRKEVFSLVGRFDTELGRKGEKLMGGEEVFLYYRISKYNRKFVYNPKAVVFHKINNKLTKEYVLKNAICLGMSDSYIERKIKKPKYLIKYARSVIYILLYPISYLNQILLHRSEPVKFMKQYMLQYSMGYLKLF